MVILNPCINFLKRTREPVNGLTHAIGALLSLIGMIILVWVAREHLGRVLVLAIFGVSMVLLYTASTVMHWYNGSKEMVERLIQIDHAAIYLLIAGSYTPFVYTFFTDVWRWGLLISVWSLAAVGLILKLNFDFYGHLSTGFYVAMGWIAIIALPKFLSMGNTEALGLILGGGIIYTVGAVIFAIKKPNFHVHFGYHEIWHLFVMGGSAFHFLAAFWWVAR